MLGADSGSRTTGSSPLRGVLARLLESRNLRSSSRVGLVLMYHRIGPGSGDPSRNLVPQLDLGVFRAQLAHLMSRYEVVPLKKLRPRVASRSRGERLPVALTFDDDRETHIRYVIPLLAEAGVPATFFLTGASLRGKSSFWWQDLESMAARGGEAWRDLMGQLVETVGLSVTGSSLSAIARTIESMPPQDRDRVAERIRAAAGTAATDRVLSPDEIKRIARSGFEIGFHTLRHHNLQTLPAEQLEEALTDGLDDIADLTGQRPTSIAYPHCRADLGIAEAARASGFELGCVCEGGAVAAADHPLLMDRIDGWSTTTGQFALKLARAVRAEPDLGEKREAAR